MSTIGYKVVSRDDRGRLQSARIRPLSPWCVTYQVGTRTEGHDGTPVLAFKSRGAAKSFAYSHQPIYRASLENPQPVGRLVFPHLSRLFSPFWERECPADWDSTFPAPWNTLACDAVILLEEVKR